MQEPINLTFAAMMKRKPEKNSGLYGICQTYNLSYTGAANPLPPELYQANWELVILSVHNKPVEDEGEVTNIRKYKCVIG